MVAMFPMTDFDAWTQETPRFLSPIATANGLETTDRQGLRDLSPLYRAEEYTDTSLFLLHGTVDTVVPIHHSQDFVAAVEREGGSILLKEVPGLGHKDEVARDYQDAIFKFLDQGMEAAQASLAGAVEPALPDVSTP